MPIGVWQQLPSTILAVLAIASWVAPALSDELGDLNEKVLRLYKAGKYSDAIPLAQRAVTRAKRQFGADHPYVGTTLNNLGLLYKQLGNHGDAEALYKRSLLIRKKVLGPNDLDVANSLNNLGTLYLDDGRYAEAEPLLKRALAISEKTLGPDHPDVAASLNNLAELYQAQGRYAAAEPLYKRALAINEKSLGPDNPNVATSLNNLALLYREQGRYADAEPLLKRSFVIREKAFGTDHPDVAAAYDNLASLFREEGRYAEAEPLLQRALAIRERVLGRHHLDVAISLSNLGGLYRQEGRIRAAELLFERALRIREKLLGPDHIEVGNAVNNLADVYRIEGRTAEAELLYKRAITISEKALGGTHFMVAAPLNNLAFFYEQLGRYAEAEPIYERALAIDEKFLGPDHPTVATLLHNLGMLHFMKSDWARAVDLWRRSTSLIARRTEHGIEAIGQPLTGKAKSEAERSSWQFWGLVKAAYRLTKNSPGPGLSADMFRKGQWAQGSEAAASLAKMAARGATANPKLAAIVRERQDLVAEWQQRDKARVAVASQLPDKRNREAEAANMARLAEIVTRIDVLDKRLGKDFPDYAALVSPKPLSVADVQSLLHENEALVLLLDTPQLGPVPEETFIWVVTKSDSRWVRSEIGAPSLKREVAALRCGLDYDGSWGVAGSQCTELLESTYLEPIHTGTDYSETDHENGKPLPFGLAKAYALYQALFGQVEDLIKDKQLLIVPSGALTQLPFQVLVAEKPDPTLGETEALRSAAWLIRSHAITVLPSVSSLKALRQLAKDSHASRTLIGFGNPLLDGRPDKYPDDRALALRARASQSCSKEPPHKVTSLRGAQRGMLPLKLRSGRVDVAQIRSQVPLPETANELCSVARDLGVSGDDIHLGAHATETEIKRLSDSGELAKYRILHVATHGALAGQVSGNSEPGLLLSPPDKATETDDGYLSASEVAALKLDADWVILSACNTAAGGAEGAEALSGLAKAFFYAGDRALLVSHWSVDSDAAVKLITGAMSRMAADRSIGRAEAMRRSMLALIDKGAPFEAQPAYWAPFVVVGEGAVRSR